jgi:hypothetical protein
MTEGDKGTRRAGEAKEEKKENQRPSSVKKMWF